MANAAYFNGVRTASGALLIAGTDGAILRSVDGGQHWRAAVVPPVAVPIVQLMEDPASSTLLAAGPEAGVLRSIDDGESWTLQATGLTTRLRSLAYSGEHRQWIGVGDNGAIVWSADSGQSWTEAINPAGVRLGSVIALADGIALAIGEKGTVLRSNNAGRDWRIAAQFSESGALTQLLYSPERVWALSAAGEVLISTPEAMSWSKVSTGLSDYLSAVTYDQTTGILLVGSASGALARSSDGGDHWTVLPRLGEFYLQQLVTVAEAGGTIYAIGAYGSLYSSVDAATSWQPSALPVTDRLTFLLSGPGVLLGLAEGGAIVRLSDGKESWQLLQDSIKTYVHSMAVAPDGKTLIGVGPAGWVVRSTDNGRHWTPLDLALGQDVYLFSLLPTLKPAALLAAGSPGVVLRTQVDATEWRQTLAVNRAERAYFLKLVENQRTGAVIALAATGTLMRSLDNGMTWHATDAVTDPQLTDIDSSLRLNVMIVVGRDGVIQRSMDGGLHWQSVPSPTTHHLYAVRYLPFLNAFLAVGATGQLLLSDATGAVWEQLKTPATASLRHIALDNQTGLVLLVGDYGTLLLASGAGLLWRRIETATTEQLRQPLIDEQTGFYWIPGRNGTLLRSKDRGFTWEHVATYTQRHLKGVLPLPDQSGVIVFGERLVRISNR